MDLEQDYETQLEGVQKTFKKREVSIIVPKSEYPELTVKVPDSWKSVQLAPLYDVHIGAREFDTELFHRHRDWIQKTPNVLSFGGGDMFDNITPSLAAKMGQNIITPEEQLLLATQELAPIQHKMLFELEGNHEFRSMKASGISSAKHLSDNLKLKFFPDYAFCTIRWRGNNFRLLAHHGSGAATTPGAQRNAARKDINWAKFDIFWTGHLHQPLADVVYGIDHDQKTGKTYERNSVVMISPSYLRYFGGYGAKQRYLPGIRGLGVIELQEDGRIDISLHARGKRL